MKPEWRAAGGRLCGSNVSIPGSPVEALWHYRLRASLSRVQGVEVRSEASYEHRRASWLKKNPQAPVRPFLGKPNGTDLAVTPVEPLPKMLVGWEQIADYLGVPSRVARGFHKDYGLPVIRIARKRVFVHRDAVVEWFFRLDRMQRKFIDEAVSRLAPGVNPGPAQRHWRRYLKEKSLEQREDVDSASFR